MICLSLVQQGLPTLLLRFLRAPSLFCGPGSRMLAGFIEGFTKRGPVYDETAMGFTYLENFFQVIKKKNAFPFAVFFELLVITESH